MKRVLATGVFDILHPGHIYYLTEAKKLGGFLLVLVTSDKVASREKRQPVFNQSDRLDMVKTLSVVDKAVIGLESGDYCQTINTLKPDIIALGYDQKSEQILKEKLNKCNWYGEIVKIGKYPNKNQSTTKIINKIKRNVTDTNNQHR